jgi:hypothetical protein
MGGATFQIGLIDVILMLLLWVFRQARSVSVAESTICKWLPLTRP